MMMMMMVLMMVMMMMVMMMMVMMMIVTVIPFLQVMQSWFASVKLLKDSRSQAATLAKMHLDELAGAYFNRWRTFTRLCLTVTSARSSISRAIVIRVFRQWFFEWQHNRRIRDGLQELVFDAGVSRMMKAMRIWRGWTQRVRQCRTFTLFYKEKRLAFYLRTCFAALQDHLKHRSNTRAATRDVYALVERAQGEFLGRIFGEWRLVTGPRKMAMLAAMIMG